MSRGSASFGRHTGARGLGLAAREAEIEAFLRALAKVASKRRIRR